MGSSAADRHDPARGARDPGRDQPRRHVRAHGASFRRTDQPVLGPAVRRRHRSPADHAWGRRPAAGVGHRDDEPGRAAKSGHRRSESRGIPRGLGDPRKKDRSFPAGDRRLRRGHDVSGALACSWRRAVRCGEAVRWRRR